MKTQTSLAAKAAPETAINGVEVLSPERVLGIIMDTRQPWQQGYRAFYSSVYRGIVREPRLMLLPVDDHVVHRGDGVFDTAKCAGGRIYQLDAHLARLCRSAAAIGLKLPVGEADLSRIVVATVKAGGAPDCYIRTVVSRGPGGFTPNPFECPESQLYVIAYTTAPYPETLWTCGVKAVVSKVPVKPGLFANVKSCNYLPNVMMKKEAVEAGAAFALSVDEKGFLAEGAAENAAIVAADGRLKVPRFERILKGITVSRLVELAEKEPLPGGGPDFSDISLTDIFEARELLLLGTSFDVLPVVELGGRQIAGGKPGPVARRLREMVLADIMQNPEASTPAFG